MRGGKKIAELSNTQIEALLRSYLEKLLHKDEIDKSMERRSCKGKEDPNEHVDAMAYLQHDCRRELAIGNYSRASGAVEGLLKEKGIALDRDGVSYEKLCRGMMKVMINHLEIDIRRTRLDNSLNKLPFPELLKGESFKDL
jgi:hypothetical protein